MTINHQRKKKKEVGKVTKTDEVRGVYYIVGEIGDVQWTDEFIESSDKYFIEDGTAYESQLVSVCEECDNEAFFDSHNQEYYCPRCEQ